jgi:hypothetical protein
MVITWLVPTQTASWTVAMQVTESAILSLWAKWSCQFPPLASRIFSSVSELSMLFGLEASHSS